MRWRVEAVGGLAVLTAPRHHYLSGRTRAETLTPIGTLSFECTQTTKRDHQYGNEHTATGQACPNLEQQAGCSCQLARQLADRAAARPNCISAGSVPVATQSPPPPPPPTSSSCCCLLSAYQCGHLSHTGFVLYVCLFSLACNRSPACSALVAVSVCRMLSLPLVSRWRCPMIPICTSTLHCTSALMASQVRACVPCSESNKR